MSKSVNNKANVRFGSLPVLLLVLCVLVSGTVLCLRIGSYTYAKAVDKDISIAPQGENTLSTDKSVGLNNNSTDKSDKQPSSGFKAEPGLEVDDSDTVWGTDTDIEIFRVSYENGERIVTAVSGNGDKTVAPGTENEYTFRISNTGNVAMDYTLKTTASLIDGENTFEIPLVVRLSDYTGRYLVGTDSSWAAFTDLDNVSEKGVVGVNRCTYYTLEWQWPFESGDDAFDTMLGNIAVERDLVLTVTLSVTAEQDDDPTAGGGIPQMGDSIDEVFILSAAAISASLLLLVLSIINRRKAK